MKKQRKKEKGNSVRINSKVLFKLLSKKKMKIKTLKSKSRLNRRKGI